MAQYMAGDVTCALAVPFPLVDLPVCCHAFARHVGDGVAGQAGHCSRHVLEAHMEAALWCVCAKLRVGCVVEVSVCRMFVSVRNFALFELWVNLEPRITVQTLQPTAK